MKNKSLLTFLIVTLLYTKGYTQLRSGTAFLVTQFEIVKEISSDSVLINYNSIICIPHDLEASEKIRNILQRENNKRQTAIEWIKQIQKLGDLMPFINKKYTREVHGNSNFDTTIISRVSNYKHFNPTYSNILDFTLPTIYSNKNCYMKVYEINYTGYVCTFDNYTKYKRIYYSDDFLQNTVPHTEYSKNKKEMVKIDTIKVSYLITLNNYFKNHKPLRTFLEVSGKVLNESPCSGLLLKN